MAWCDVVEPRTLRECRIVLGQSQAAFAAMLGVSPESYRTWDAGRRATPPHVMARARALATHRDEHALLPLPRPSAAGLAHGVHGRRARRGYSGVGLYSKLGHCSIPTFASMWFRNHCRLRNSSWNFPLNDSSVAFCHGVPWSISAVSMPASPSQRRMAVATNYQKRPSVIRFGAGIVRLIRLDPKNLQSRTIRLQVDATRPGRRLGLV